MILSAKAGLVILAGIAGGAFLCPLCEGDGNPGTAQIIPNPAILTQPVDTATVRLHISGMTCGGCATTARLALRKLDGVLDAKVTIADSLGVVRYDPQRTGPSQIAQHLTRLTGYQARILPDSVNAVRKP
ncbi:MAG: heavy-metal-associated domain-containing protein [Gemmatimonadales bacterium]